MHDLALPTTDLLRTLADARRSLATAWAMRSELLELGASPEGADVPAALADGALARGGLVADGRLLVRTGLRRGQVFVVDPDTSTGVEADRVDALLLQLAQQAWGTPDAVVDPCCGCGEVALSIETQTRLMLDRDPRALAFADLNRILNGVPESRALLGLSDLRAGLPRVALGGLSGTVLCVAALPCASGDAEPGDERAVEQAALDAIAAVRRALPRTSRLRALFGMPVSPPADDDARAGLAERAAAAFGRSQVRWSELDAAFAGRTAAAVADRSYGALAVELD